MQDETLRNTSDLITLLQNHLESRMPLFRGQNVDEPLIPTFARLAKRLDLVQPDVTEQRMFDRFKKEAFPYVSSLLPLDSLESREMTWLSIAQHYGLPTRLLDWTANPFAALWFAVQPNARGEPDKPVLWAWEPDDADVLYDPDHESPWKLAQTRVFQPFHIDRRIAAQAAWFSVHQYSHKAKEYVPLSEHESAGKLKKWWVTNAEDIRLNLLKMGVSRATLFPDLNGISQSLILDVELERLR